MYICSPRGKYFGAMQQTMSQGEVYRGIVNINIKGSNVILKSWYEAGGGKALLGWVLFRLAEFCLCPDQ